MKSTQTTQSRMNNVARFSVVLLIAQAVAFSASAGEVLRFRKGSTDPLAASRNFSTATTLAVSAEYIVQFDKKITNQDRQWLKAQNIQVLRYLPDDAFIVRTDAGFPAQAVRANSRVRAVMPLEAKYKLADELPSASVFNANQTVDVMISTWSKKDSESLQKILQNSENARLLRGGQRTVVAQIPMSLLASLSRQRGIEYIQPVYAMKTMLFAENENPPATITYGAGDYSDMTGFESGAKLMNFEKAYELGFTGKGQIAGMADTGLDTGIPAQLLTDVKDAYLDGQIFGQFSKSWEDGNGHGTHVAGSILGNGANSNGAIKGGAYEGKLVVQSLWNALFQSLTLPKDLADLIKPAYAKGARVHSNSWGSTAGFGLYDANAQEVDDYIFKNQDILVVFAAGNNGMDANKDGVIDENSISSPGTAKNVLTVGASENIELTRSRQTPKDFGGWNTKWPSDPIASSKISDNANGIAFFSSRGPTKDGRIKPDVVAPGVNILSLRSQVPGAKLWGDYNKYYAWAGGTSMATPLTSGAALIVRQYLKEKMNVQNPSAALLKATLMLTATDIFPGQYGEGATQEIKTVRPEVNEGFGRVDVASAVTLDQNGGLIDDRAGVATDEERSFLVEMKADGIFEAQMAYTDAAGSPSAAVALVNDVDLSLVDEAGQVVVSKTDRLNNYEYIHQTLKAGKYTLKVKGFKVPSGLNGKQPFALVFRQLASAPQAGQ